MAEEKIKRTQTSKTEQTESTQESISEQESTTLQSGGTPPKSTDTGTSDQSGAPDTGQGIDSQPEESPFEEPQEEEETPEEEATEEEPEEEPEKEEDDNENEDKDKEESEDEDGEKDQDKNQDSQGENKEEPEEPGKPKPAEKAAPEGPDVGKEAADAGKGAADAGKAAGDVATTGAELGGEAAAAGAEAGVVGAEAGATAGTGGAALIPIAVYEVGKRALANKTVRRILEIIAWTILIIAAIIIIIIVLLILGIFLWFAGSGPSGSSNKQDTPIAEQTTAIGTPTGEPTGLSQECSEKNKTAINTQNFPLHNIAYASDELYEIKSTYELIANSPDNCLSPEFKSWAAELAQKDQDYNNFFYQDIKKADTAEETLPLLEKSTDILEKVDDYKNNIDPDNEEVKYYNKLKNFYQIQDNALINLADFNETFEYLLLQAGRGGEIKGNMVNDAALRQSRQQYLEPLMNYLTERKIAKLTALESNDTEYINDQISEIEKHRDLVVATINEETVPRDDKYPPALEFEDEREYKILLPQTKGDYEEYGEYGILVDTRIYYLLSYIFHVQEMTGPDYEIYKNSQVIQDASTPTDILSMCAANLEDDPSYCGYNTFCGVGQRLYSQKWLTDNVDNIGVPYKDRAHLKIWLGLNSPYYADEIPTSYNQADKLIQVFNTHYDYKAIDISEIGLYNERIDCAACKGLSACSGTCADNPFPCCPVELDSAADQYIGVPVVWQHNQKATAILDTATSDIFPSGMSNNYGIPAQFGGLAQTPIADLFNTYLHPGNFNYYQLANGNTLNLFTQMGYHALAQILSQIGLSPNVMHSTNFNNPNTEALGTNLGLDYINNSFNLPDNYHTPLSAALMSGNYPATAIDLINYSLNLHLPPSLHTRLINAIENQKKQQAAKYALANAGIKEINNQITNWPAATIDPSPLAGQGIKGLGNRLGELSFSEIIGFPTNYLFDTNNLQNTYISKSASLLSEATNNQKISYFVNNSLLNNNIPNLKNTLTNLTANDVTQLFGTDQNTTNQIIDYISDNSSFTDGHTSFVSQVSQNIDYQQSSELLNNLTEYSLKTSLEQGTSSNLGDQYILSSIAGQAILEKIGTNISDSDADKIPYLLEYIAAEQKYPLQTNTNLLPAELTALQIKFAQTTGSSESLAEFRQRLIEAIENSTRVEELTKTYQYLTGPIKIKFDQSAALNQFGQDYNQNIHSTKYQFSDTSYLPNYTQTSGQVTYQPINNILASTGIDINSLTLISENDFDNDQISNNTTISTNQIYYAYPTIDLPEIIFPGIRPNYQYQNNLGQFKLLESLTNVIANSQDQPIVINIYESNSTNLIATAGIDNPFKTAMRNKYVLSYSPLENYTQSTDFLAHLGGSDYLFETLNQIGANDEDVIEKLSNIGSIALAYRYNGINLTNFTSLDINQEQVANIINTAGIINGYAQPDLTYGIENITNFVRNQNVFSNITKTHPNINQDNIYNDFANGNYFDKLSNINQVNQHFNNYSSSLGNLTPEQFLNNFVQTPNPGQIWNNTQNIIAQNVSAQSGLSFNNALSQTQNIINQNPGNIFNLLGDSSIQNSVFDNYSPNYINDISNIGNNIINSNLSLNSGLGAIGSGQLIHNLGGMGGYNNFANQFGSLSNLSGQTLGNITNNVNSYFTSQINNWTSSYQNNIFNNGLTNLFNGNIQQFLSNTSSNYLNANLPGNYGNLTNQLLNGNLSYTQLTNNLLPNLTNALNNNNVPSLANLTQNINSGFGTSINPLNNLIGGFTGDEIFTNCRQKIAQDNIVHLTDIISSFYLNKRTQFYYGIQTDDNGQLLPEDEGTEQLVFPNFFPHQIFNHFTQETIDIIADKTTKIFKLIYPRDDEGLIDINQRNDIWRNDCIGRDNQYLPTCKEYLHVNF